MKREFIHIKTAILLIVLLTSCEASRFNLEKGLIPVVPQNFSEVNSEYDDYNSALHEFFSKSFTLTFSTNRESEGKNFDFIHYACGVSSNLVTGEFEIYANRITKYLTDSINTPANELGPYMVVNLVYPAFQIDSLTDSQKRFFYATDFRGNLDIKMVNYKYEHDGYSIRGGINDLPEINSSFDDCYPTIYYIEQTKRELLYFTSNRDGDFDIYEAVSNENTLINNSLGISITKVTGLCSESEDKCPYIIGNTMVFTSNRPGGYGGFDLWYAIYNGSTWSDPKNFGNRINTEYDEYRPVIFDFESYNYHDEFFNNFMIFSSNRPGGLGGFDLYYVGINKDLK